MPQSNVIFGFLFAAFVIFITQRGELPIYLGFLFNPAPPPSNDATDTGSGATDPTGAFGQTPATPGQAKFNSILNGWVKNLFGG